MADKQLISCCFILDGFLDIEESHELKSEMEEVVKKYMLKNNITKCERSFLSESVIDMITEYI